MHAIEVADRVHRLAHAHVNCYVIDDDDGVTLVMTLVMSWGRRS